MATPNPPLHICTICGFQAQTYAVLVHHAAQTYAVLVHHAAQTAHSTLRCCIHPCSYTYSARGQDYKAHMKSLHPETHQCHECQHIARTPIGLGYHASTLGHAAFACDDPTCSKTFSRLDTYQRHKKSHQKDAKRHPCKYCKKHRGSNGFKRKDHLTQHLRNYPHIGEQNVMGNLDTRGACHHEDCEYFVLRRPIGQYLPREKWTFKTSAEWVTHMRVVHDESEFPCPMAGCGRVRGKGYFRKADLRAHLRKVHEIDDCFAYE
jgi:hypothetical protein